MATLAPSMSACAVANGISRRNRKYKRVRNTEKGSG
jgi:hypothetical protein